MENKIFITQNNATELEIVERVIVEIKEKLNDLEEKGVYGNDKTFLEYDGVSIGDIEEYFLEYSIKKFIFLVASEKDLIINENNYMELMNFHRVGYQIFREINQLLYFKNTKSRDMESIRKICFFPIIDSYLMLILEKDEYLFLRKSIKSIK